MRRALFGLYTYIEFFALSIAMLPVFAVVALFKRATDPTRRARGRVMRFYGWLTSSLTPIWRFSVTGEAPADIGSQSYVVVSNHESTADPFLLTHLPFDMRFIAKEELFHLPLIGWLMQLGGDIPLKRGDAASVRRMFQACRETLDGGLSVMVFPEGTRSPDGVLLPFKDGAFQLAIESQRPLLPLAVAGTRQCRPKGSLWFGRAKARVRILEPVPTAGMTLNDLPTLREQVRARIQAAAVELRQELGMELEPGVRETRPAAVREA